jgi:ribonuclease J
MTITIHRGIDQIGGCITEIASASGTKILIDLGHNLPEGDNRDNDPLEKAENIDSILDGVDAVFYTHSHGDHVGFEAHVAEKGIPQYIGTLSKALLVQRQETLLYNMQRKKKWVKQEDVEAAQNSIDAFNSFITFEANKPEKIGDITVTPYFVSHSAADAYMFVVECDGHTVLHTGDFRDHGYRGKGLLPTIRTYIARRKVDVLITEGTMLGRDDSRMMSEETLCQQATELMQKYKYIFVMCTSQDADRILSIHNATKAQGRRMLVDGYQWKVLKKFEDLLGAGPRTRYHYPKKYCYHKHWDEVMSDDCKRGFTMLVRNNQYMRNYLDRIMKGLDKEQCCLVYSQFLGYILPDHSAFQKTTYDFVHSRDWNIEYLHTSGHASRDALAMVCEKVNPRLAIIPIHRQANSDFRSLDIPQDLKDKVHTESTKLEDIEIIIK